MKSRICFVSLMNLHTIPYLSKYTTLLNEPFDIIYWDRYDLKEESNAKNIYKMNYSISRTGLLQKAIGYIRFHKFAQQILAKNGYEKVILLSGNVAVLLKGILLKQYQKRYIIDIRDYFMEKNKLYYRAEKTVIENSALAIISSEAYKNFLPQYNYIITHNSPNLTSDQIDDFRSSVEMKRIREMDEAIILSFIGGVRFLEQDKRILSYFANDSRFLIRYIGAGAEQLRKHCDEECIKNVYLHDRFKPEQTLMFYKSTDMILNLYGSGTPQLDYALSNKLYYAATLRIPIIVCPNTYMESVTVNYGFGFALDLDDKEKKEDLINYYRNINYLQFSSKCEIFLKLIEDDERIFEREVKKYFLSADCGEIS